jgi:ribosomal protein S18 acetylase RimI-like enzyme
MNITVKPLSCLDYKSAYDILKETFVREECMVFSNNWKYRSYDKSIGLFTREGDLLGFILVSNHRNYIHCIAVHPDFQNYSVGTKLLQHLLQDCIQSSSNLYLIPATDRLKHWYGRKGFQITQTFQSLKNQRGTYMNFHSHGTRKQRSFLQAILQ